MKLRIITLVLYTLVIFNNASSQTVIKMKREGGISIIPCKVNGLNLDFIFDTGASNVSLSMTEASFMLKNGYLSERDILGTNKFSDATGVISEGVIINLKEIEIAGLKLYNVKASIVKNNKAPLLLGQSAIGKLGVIQLDLEKNTLTILSGKGSFDFSENYEQRQQVSNNVGFQSNNRVTGIPIKLGNLEVAQYDFPNAMNWYKAKDACTKLGNGWRLPTKDELDKIYQNRNRIQSFTTGNYWSSTESEINNAFYMGFDYGGLDFVYKSYTGGYVRPVRSL